MNYLAFILCFLALSYSTLAQKQQLRKSTRPTTFQGICGVVLEKKGNHMPGPGKSASQGTPIEREVLIFPLLNMNQVKMGDNGFIDSVGNVKPIKTVKSDKSGKFCANLPVGHYSVVVRESKGLYANLSDAHNNIFPVNVRKNIRSEVKIEVTHQGVF
ncbi:hypothetical protein [Spirosoma panaciterrae]|uniref:hypothetical protein n=1 Tax=Spirosoma panaciterrae TaxID=496058 RepID=UPI00037CEAE4|nr:hypothetical protein [Spirosoma panaciterrae]